LFSSPSGVAPSGFVSPIWDCKGKKVFDICKKKLNFFLTLFFPLFNLSLSLAPCDPLFVLGLQRWELFLFPASVWGYYFLLKGRFCNPEAAAALKSEDYKVKICKTNLRGCL